MGISTLEGKSADTASFTKCWSHLTTDHTLCACRKGIHIRFSSMYESQPLDASI